MKELTLRELTRRIGKPCVWCGVTVHLDNISRVWCDPCCINCAKKREEENRIFESMEEESLKEPKRKPL